MRLGFETSSLKRITFFLACPLPLLSAPRKRSPGHRIASLSCPPVLPALLYAYLGFSDLPLFLSPHLHSTTSIIIIAVRCSAWSFLLRGLFLQPAGTATTRQHELLSVIIPFKYLWHGGGF